MGFRFRRSVKILPGIRLNFGKRGISTSIGVRGAHITYGATGTRTTVGLPGTGLSYTHLDKPHRQVPINPAAATIPQASAARGGLWMILITVAVISAIGRCTASGTPPQMPQPPARLQTSVPVAGNPQSAILDRAARGADQIRGAVANSQTLRFSRVTAMPNGSICYRFQLRNSRGVSYVRTAVMDGAVLRVSGGPNFDTLWNQGCAHDSDSHEITAPLKSPVFMPPPSPR